MLKLEQIYFGNINKGNRTQFPITIYEQVHFKYCVVLTIQGILIEPQRWYIRGDNMYELYTESRRIARHFIKQPYIDVIVLLFSQQIRTPQQWYYYRPLVIYK